MKARRFVLLDRDGTVNVERHYLASPDGVELLPNAAAGLRRLRELGFGLIIVTNQSGLGRGYFCQSALDAVHQRLHELLTAERVVLDGIYYCPHTEEAGCCCRKPRAGLALRAAAELGFDPAESIVIGDRPSDLELGWGLGAVSILVRTGYGAASEKMVRAHFVVADLLEAAGVIERYVARCCHPLTGGNAGSRRIG
jgi:D-glycero-D-manno-heptose 1,7-bisphosphate phosphatase